MKIAIIHDYIKEYGGAERVLETFHEMWPDADIYTTVFLPEFLGPHAKRFEGWNIKTSWLQNIPLVHKLISPIRIIAPCIFENWDFSSYDLIIVSATGAYFPNLIIRKPETLHLCYCHTPPRYLYGYPTARNWRKNPIMKLLGELFNHKLRIIDFISYQRPDFLIANSEEVRRRINKFYRRDAVVIYPPATLCETMWAGPPVEISVRRKAESGKDTKRYFLAGGRLARAKRIDLAIKACNELELPLKIFGKGFADYGSELKEIAGSTIEFLGEVKDEELKSLYRNAKALLFPSEMEDFGIMPVEAQSEGTPVIAYGEGGVRETVIDGKTGILFKELTEDSLIQGIKRFEKMKIDPEDCIENARRFGKERFKKEIMEFVNKKTNNK